MIIAFYPGGGGNRFYQWVNKDQRNFVVNEGYDKRTPHQIYVNRYPGALDNQIDAPIVFTHCMNYDLINATWPKHELIYIIKSDFHKSLKRQWHLFQSNVSENTHPAGGPFSTIKWHTDYYTDYPYQVGKAIEVNDSSYPEFMQMLTAELETINCPEYDFASSMFDQYGKDAPILDLYNKHYEQR